MAQDAPAAMDMKGASSLADRIQPCARPLANQHGRTGAHRLPAEALRNPGTLMDSLVGQTNERACLGVRGETHHAKHTTKIPRILTHRSMLVNKWKIGFV